MIKCHWSSTFTQRLSQFRRNLQLYVESDLRLVFWWPVGEVGWLIDWESVTCGPPATVGAEKRSERRGHRTPVEKLGLSSTKTSKKQYFGRFYGEGGGMRRSLEKIISLQRILKETLEWVPIFKLSGPFSFKAFLSRCQSALAFVVWILTRVWSAFRSVKKSFAFYSSERKRED